jgi:hypothetical protein
MFLHCMVYIDSVLQRPDYNLVYMVDIVAALSSWWLYQFDMVCMFADL